MKKHYIFMTRRITFILSFFSLLFIVQLSFARDGFVPECSIDRGISIPTGYPTASTTGLAGAGVDTLDLIPHNGLFTDLQDTVIEGYDITGFMHLKRCSTVTIRNCRITGDGDLFGIRIETSNSMITIENCQIRTIDEGTTVGITVIGGSIDSLIVRNCDISGGADGMKVSSNNLIEGNYIHHLYKWFNPEERDGLGDTTHNDCLQTLGADNVIIRANTLMGPYHRANSTFQCQTDKASITNIAFESNYLSGGGNCLNIREKNGHVVSNMVVRNNLWEDDTFLWGPYYNSTAEVPVSYGNRFTSGGQCDIVTNRCLPNENEDDIIVVRTESINAETDDRQINSNGSSVWVGKTTIRVGGAASNVDGCAVYPFALPALEEGESIVSANLNVSLERIANSPEGNVDVYALPYRSSSTALASDFWQGDYGTDQNATAIQDDFATLSSAPGILSLDTDASVTLADYINAQFAAGAQAGDYIFIRLNPDYPDVRDYFYWSFHTANSSNIPSLDLEIEGGSEPVIVLPTSITVSPDGLDLDIGESYQLTETVLPAEAYDKTVSWSSDNSDIASVDASGNVSANAEGTAIITATTNSGGLTAQCVVNVSVPIIIDEDFSSGASDFTVINGGTWAVSGGRYVLSSPALGPTGLLGNISVHNTVVTGDFELSTLLNITGTTSTWNDAAVVFDFQDADNYYYVSLNETNDQNTKGIFKVENGVSSELVNIDILIEDDTDYILEINKTGNDIVVSLDGAQIASATDATFSNGQVGYGTKNDGAQFDDLLVSSSGSAAKALKTKSSISNSLSKILVYPNPNPGNNVSIELPAKYKEANITVYEISGKLIIQQSVYGEQHININLSSHSNLKKGVYIIEIKTPMSREISKLIVR